MTKCEAAKIIPTSGTFSSYLSSLRSNGLIDEFDGEVCASTSLFLYRESITSS
jgi:hypothetical protein